MACGYAEVRQGEGLVWGASDGPLLPLVVPLEAKRTRLLSGHDDERPDQPGTVRQHGSEHALHDFGRVLSRTIAENVIILRDRPMRDTMWIETTIRWAHTGDT